MYRGFGSLVTSRQSGFSLLEAIVAITLLASVGGALLVWVNVLVSGIGRIEQSTEIDRVTAQSLAAIELINPMREAEGRLRLGEYAMSWESSLIVGPNRVVNRFGSPGDYVAALYELEVEVYQGRRSVSRYKVRQVGYERINRSD